MTTYWWMIITIPAIAFLIYWLAKNLNPKDEPNSMFGISIFGIVLGIAAGLHFGAKFEPYHTIIMFLAGVVVVKYALDLIAKAK